MPFDRGVPRAPVVVGCPGTADRGRRPTRTDWLCGLSAHTYRPFGPFPDTTPTGNVRRSKTWRPSDRGGGCRGEGRFTPTGSLRRRKKPSPSSSRGKLGRGVHPRGAFVQPRSKARGSCAVPDRAPPIGAAVAEVSGCPPSPTPRPPVRPPGHARPEHRVPHPCAAALVTGGAQGHGRAVGHGVRTLDSLGGPHSRHPGATTRGLIVGRGDEKRTQALGSASEELEAAHHS